MNDDLLSLVERDVLGWPGTSSAPGRFPEAGHARTGLAREATSATRWKVGRTPRRSWRY